MAKKYIVDLSKDEKSVMMTKVSPTPELSRAAKRRRLE